MLSDYFKTMNVFLRGGTDNQSALQVPSDGYITKMPGHSTAYEGKGFAVHPRPFLPRG